MRGAPRSGLAVTDDATTLEAALVALGAREGDEVTVPAWAFVASATAIPARTRRR